MSEVIVVNKPVQPIPVNVINSNLPVSLINPIPFSVGGVSIDELSRLSKNKIVIEYIYAKCNPSITTANGIVIEIQGGSSPKLFFKFDKTIITPPINNQFHYLSENLKMVINAKETLSIKSDTTNPIDIFVSGYEY